ncbi:MAG: trigger factor [Elusimicrobia bacterium]|nr:trigger factor [Elusimicrobiota bacterium]
MENMKVDILEKKGCKVEIKAEIPADEVEKERTVVFADIQQNAVISGFRKGHAPMDFVKREFAKTALNKTLQNLMTSAIEKIIKEQDLHPVVTPEAEPEDYNEGKPFSFKLKVEQVPEFEPKDYKKIKITKKIKKITEKEVNEVIKNLQDRRANLIDAGDIAAEPHHFLVADYDGIIDGKKIDKPIENQTIDLSHKSLPEGFATGLVGMKSGETKTIETKISDKPAKLDIKIKSIKKKVLPEVNDEFAKDFGHENVSQLKEKIKEDIIKTEEEKTRQDMESQIIESLLKSNDFPVPETLVEYELNNMIDRTKQYLVSNHSFNQEEFEKSIPAMRDKYKTDAEKTVHSSYLLSKIIKNENINVDEDEINKKIEEISGGDKKVAENYQKYREYLSLQIKEKKLFDFLLENAKIKEVKA